MTNPAMSRPAQPAPASTTTATLTMPPNAPLKSKPGRRLPHALNITRTLLAVYYAYMVEYRAELMFWVLSGSLPLILLGVWTQAAQGGSLALSPAEFARYFLIVFLTRQLTVVWVIWDVEKEVVQGKLSFRLLQPLDPVWHHFASHAAERLARIPFIAILIGLFFSLYPEALWWPSPSRLSLFLIAVFLAFCLRFLVQYTFAMFAFWIERAVAIERFWYLFYLFLSGMAAPLAMFPPLVAQIAMWTPFPYLIYFPVAVLLELDTPVIQGFGVMLLWLALFGLANRYLWHKGLQRYSGMGA